MTDYLLWHVTIGLPLLMLWQRWGLLDDASAGELLWMLLIWPICLALALALMGWAWLNGDFDEE